jgi:hypothetical protein
LRCVWIKLRRLLLLVDEAEDGEHVGHPSLSSRSRWLRIPATTSYGGARCRWKEQHRELASVGKEGEMDEKGSGVSVARLEAAGGPPGRQAGDAGDGMVATHLCVPLPGKTTEGGGGLGRLGRCPRRQVSLFLLFCLFNLSFLVILFCILFSNLIKIAKHF